MAQIGISISTKHGSKFEVHLNPTRDMINICSTTYIESGYNNPDGRAATQPYDLNVLNLHGTVDDLQLFADQLLEAVYPDLYKGDPDAKADTEREDNATALPGSGDVEIPAAGHRNAAVAEPLRGILNAISPEVSRG